MEKKMELECRDKNGNYKFTIKGEFAKSVVRYLESQPEIHKSLQTMKGKDGKPPYDRVIYQPIVKQGVGFKNDLFQTVIFYGDYISVIN